MSISFKQQNLEFYWWNFKQINIFNMYVLLCNLYSWKLVASFLLYCLKPWDIWSRLNSRIYTSHSFSDQWKATHALWSSWASTEISGHTPVYIHKNGDHWNETKWEFGTSQKPRDPDGWTSGKIFYVKRRGRAHIACMSSVLFFRQ